MDPRPHGEKKFDLIREWLRNDSSALLDRIDEINVSSRMPSRIIDLGPCSDLRGRQLQLVSTFGTTPVDAAISPPFPLTYVTLSHRWGADRSFVTTRANVDARQHGFNFDNLPQTYQDAAVVAVRLGFRYLWIDAVCIVQDDADDWLHESEKMGNIYRFGSFTIASHCSENDQDGFLSSALRRRGSVQLEYVRLQSCQKIR
jgi:hypothetical protein